MNDTEFTIGIKPSLRVQFGRLIVATVAAFVATKMAENAYDTIIEKSRQNSTDLEIADQ